MFSKKRPEDQCASILYRPEYLGAYQRSYRGYNETLGDKVGELASKLDSLLHPAPAVKAGEVGDEVPAFK